MKIDLELGPGYRGYYSTRGGGGRPMSRVTAARPFFLARAQSPQVHRVRRGDVYHHDGYYWVAFSMWCGQSGFLRHRTSTSWKGGALLDVLPGDKPVCGTCEGRAVGAGRQSTAFLIQVHAVRFGRRP